MTFTARRLYAVGSWALACAVGVVAHAASSSKPAASGKASAPKASASKAASSKDGSVSMSVSSAQGLVGATAKVANAAHDMSGVAALCAEVETFYAKMKWGESHCKDIPFESFGKSVGGRPLLMFRSGQSDSKLTVVQCAIHGDEMPTLAICLNLIREIIDGTRQVKAGQSIVVQPLLNPDGLLAVKPTRNNAHGVDINRNFPTRNWGDEALKSWGTRDRKDPRKYPGAEANSEPETQALVAFLETQMATQKIISIHTPLGFLDLDAGKTDKDRERRARYLAINIVKNSGNYKFRNFGVYPGSLGNYVGNERKIPVYTLELPGGGSTAAAVTGYWNKFRTGLWRAIDFDLDTGQFTED